MAKTTMDVTDTDIVMDFVANKFVYGGISSKRIIMKQVRRAIQEIPMGIMRKIPASNE